MPNVDTLKAYETLTAADMPDRQARALVAIVQELQEARLAEVASKADLKELEARIDVKLANIEIKISALEAKIDRVKFDLLKWFIPLILGQAAFIVTLLKLLK
jgi:hypothetical protein